MKNIQVLAFAPLHSPEITKVPGSLETMQSIVGGLVEIIDYTVQGCTYQIFVNEDAEPLNLPRNRKVDGRMLFGVFVVAKYVGGRFESIPNKEAVQIWKYLDFHNSTI